MRGSAVRPDAYGEDVSPLLSTLGRRVIIDANDGRADETRRPAGGSARSSARHPREQAKKLFPSRDFHRRGKAHSQRYGRRTVFRCSLHERPVSEHTCRLRVASVNGTRLIQDTTLADALA